MRVLVFAFVAVLSEVALHASCALTFEGCYAQVLQHQGESSFEQMNDNGACVEECRQKGYILAATNSKECHCTHSFPTQKIASSGSVYASGKDSACNKPCPGILEDDGCRADECCGGTTKDGEKAYSVYAVGGIDIPSQVWKRVQKNLFGLINDRRFGRMILLWQQLGGCHIFERFTGKLLFRQNNIKAASTPGRCQRYCDREESFACLAYSFKKVIRNGEVYLGECRLYDQLTPLKTAADAQNTDLYIRRCLLDTTSGDSAKKGPPTVLHNGGDVIPQGVRGFLTSRHPRTNTWSKICMTDKAAVNDLIANVGCRQVGFQAGYAWPYRPEVPEPTSYSRTDLHCQGGAKLLQQHCIWRQRSMCEKGAMYVFCYGKGPIMINKRLPLELKNHKRELEEQTPLSLVPMESYDLELDNINSNINQLQSYSKETEQTSTMMWRCETGFQVGKSKTTSTSTSHAWSKSDTTVTSIDVTVGAEAGGGFGGFKASVSTDITNSWSDEVTHATSGRRTDSSSVTKATRHIFSENYAKTVIKSKSVTQVYSLLVPPFHRGFMNFFKEVVPMSLKWRSTFWLGGNIELQYGPLQKNISVVNLLLDTQRTFFTLGSLDYTATKLISQVTLKDAHGKTTAPIGNGVKCSQPDCKRWHGDQGMCDGVLCVTDFPLDCSTTVKECLQEHPSMVCER